MISILRFQNFANDFINPKILHALIIYLQKKKKKERMKRKKERKKKERKAHMDSTSF